MEVSRITRGKIDLRKERVELATVVQSAVETSRPLIERARHSLTVTLPPEPLAVEADPVRLAQVIANLLNNAAKYTEEEGHIQLTAAAEGDKAVVSVRDDGLGIPPNMLPRVFDLFAQVDQTLQRAQGGLGIGLALVRSLVELHGGRVEARSEGAGRGSEFVVRLPLAPGSHARGEAAPGEADPQAAVPLPHRVLVVDDNRDAADSLGMLLKLLGADVKVVYDGLSALEVIGTFSPAVVLMDIGMPGLDGHEVARRVRHDLGLREVTLIAMTGWGQEDDRRRSQEAGFNHHVVKPIDVDALQTLLASLPAAKPGAGR
jgi:CheY-like chemotaxis protein/two-component sensor histidine kinase